MESRRVIVEMRVSTTRMTDREIERDVDRLILNLQGIESGETTVNEVITKEIK